MFGGALDPAAVTVRRARWWPLQPRAVIMAPDGHIWCHPQGSTWSADFAREGLGAQAHFIHELTHVWQHQCGLWLPLARLPFARYRYRLTPGRPFGDYGIEQQAEITAHAFLLREGGRAPTSATLRELAAILPFAPWR